MVKVIKPGDDYNFKYIIIDNKAKRFKIIVSENKRSENNNLVSNLKNKYKNYEFSCIESPSLFKELKFIWPQIVKDFKNNFSFTAGWLPQAKLNLNDKLLEIKVETRLAYKKLNTPRTKSFLRNRLEYYLNEALEIVIKNGDFLADLDNGKILREVANNTKSKAKFSKARDNNKQSEIIYGRKINSDISHSLKEIQSEKNRVVIKGQIFKVDKRETRSGKILLILSLTDKSDSLTAKLFLEDISELNMEVNAGDWVKISGRVIYDKYSKELTVMINNINLIEVETRTDTSSSKRVELHLHTQMSAMDSVVDVEEIIKRASEWGHQALAITDHGVVQSYPEAYQAGEKYGVKILYGIEAYMVDDGQPIIINEDNRDIKEAPYVVFDLETTGLNPFNDNIIEIGAVKINNNKIVDEYSTFIKPDKSIPDEITELTGITEDMVSDAPQIGEVMPEFIDFIGDSVLVAHNASFDYGFIQSHLNDQEYPLLDTLALSRALLPEIKNHRLNTVANNLSINLKEHHRAVHDARATAEILLDFVDRLKNKNINLLNEINELMKSIDWKDLYPYHVTILARNMDGLKTIYELVSSSHLQHFYRKPRILKSELINNRDNLIIGSACEAGQLFRALLQNKSEKEIEKITKFYDYLEIQPLGNNRFLIPEKVNTEDELKDINKRIYDLGQKLQKPVVATGDVHFIDPEEKVFRKILQTGQGYDDAENQPPIYYRTTEEMLAEFEYLGTKRAREVVIKNPNNITEMISDDIKPIPDGLFTPEIEGAEEQVRNMVYENAHSMYGKPLPDFIKSRLEKELEAIISNGYAVIYLISHKLVKKSLEDGYLVGSRGSVGSSLVATMCQITEVNPLAAHYRCPECKNVELTEDENISVGIDLPDKKCPECNTEYIKDGYDIPFEVFMGFEGDKVPDIDLNFSGEYQNKIHKETEKLFGRDYVFRAGTISTIADRTAYGFVKGYMDDHNYNLRKAEINRLVEGCTGARKTTGQHPGGLMVVPRDMDIHDFSPIQHPANDQETSVRTTHFDYHSISGRILKLDLLGHDDPTSLRMLQDLTGITPDKIPLDDPETMSIFSSTEVLGVTPEEIGTEVGTLGIPEFGTSFVRQMLVDTKPETFAELIRISGLSHGTDVWLNNAQELIKNGKAKLSEVISVRDDIMNYLIQKGLEPKKAFWIMEHVRKGKGLTDEEEQYIKQFEVPEWYIDSCKKIKYMFPKAHAAAYVMMAYRIAYFKVHYPRAFYITYFSTKAEDFDAQLISRGFEYIKDKKDSLINKGNDATAKEKSTLTVLEIVIEAMLRGIQFKNVDLYKSAAFSFRKAEEGLLPPLISLNGLGKSAAQNIITGRKKKSFTSIEDLVDRTGISKTVVEVMKDHGTLAGLPEKNQLSLF